MNPIDQEILMLFRTLDRTEQEAFVAIAAAMASGAGFLQATVAGNIVRLSADREPIPLSDISGVVQSDCEEDDHGTCS